jgi:hypothetical protein
MEPVLLELLRALNAAAALYYAEGVYEELVYFPAACPRSLGCNDVVSAIQADSGRH